VRFDKYSFGLKYRAAIGGVVTNAAIGAVVLCIPYALMHTIPAWTYWTVGICAALKTLIEIAHTAMFFRITFEGPS